MEAEKGILCDLLGEFSEPYEVGLNTCLILQYSAVLQSLLSRIAENIPNE